MDDLPKLPPKEIIDKYFEEIGNETTSGDSTADVVFHYVFELIDYEDESNDELDAVDIVEINESIQSQNSMNVLTFNHLTSVFATYNWRKLEDIKIKESNKLTYFTNEKYIALLQSKININNKLIIFEPDNYKVIFYNKLTYKCLTHCENEIQLINMVEILK